MIKSDCYGGYINPLTLISTSPIKIGSTEIIIGNLRDTFACAAMQSLIADADGDSCETTAKNAYKYADAMMAERAKK